MEFLKQRGEHFAAGFFELPDASPMRRWSRAVRRRFEAWLAPSYRGEILYPCGPAIRPGENWLLRPSYSYTWSLSRQEIERRMAESPPDEAQELAALRDAVSAWEARIERGPSRHTLGGNGYTHSIPNYGRVLREGLSGYALRVRVGLDQAVSRGDVESAAFYLGLEDVLAGVAAWRDRLLAALRASSPENPAARDRLAAALERVPFGPAQGFFEAVVAYNLVFYLDDGDNPGRVDQELYPYYARDVASGAVTRDEAVTLVRQFWRNVDACNGWSAGLGGRSPDGGAGCNDLTLVCLEAAHALRRPNLQLHVRRDTPDAAWEAAMDCLATGCGLPALYHDEAYEAALCAWDLGVAEQDLPWWNGGGCTETMIHGRSNVGSLDAGLNALLTVEGTLRRVLASAPTFEALLDAVRQDLARDVREIVDRVNAHQRTKAVWQPQPIRSLLVDDCVERGREFNAGGARYNWSVVNVGGLANVADSLAAVREVVFERREITGARLLDALLSDFAGCEELRRRLERCPRFGNDDRRCDALAVGLAQCIFSEFARHKPWRGGRFLPSCIMFTTYAWAGTSVGATPDGRRAGAPVADSAGPAQGRDRRGPTAMVQSVARLPHALAPGTLVLNARFTRRTLTHPDERLKLRQFIRTYFDLGGMQIQINVVDQATLRDALEHPDRYPELVVRIGGYSEYFSRLSPELQRSMLERIEHGL